MTRRTLTLTTAIIATILLTLSAGAAILMGRGHAKPATSEFGPGPRTSARGLYVATLQGAATLKPRKMYSLQVTVASAANGQAVSDAIITIGGGMPQHGHGFPTRPRVTNNLGNGWYEISGLRFNMGGWWELKLSITTPAGTDTVTFNLAV